MKSSLKRLLLPGGERVHTIRGGALKGLRFRLNLHQDTQVWRGIYEQSLQRWLQEHVSCDSICFDVGAAEGWATLLMATLAPQGAVHAFEPSERGESIKRNLDLNRGTPQAEVHIQRKFVGAATEVKESGSELVSLDDYCLRHEISRLDILKIDVDGPELDVLQGAKKIIAKFHPALCIEAHSRELCNGVLAELRSADYATLVVEPPPHEHRPIEYNPMVFSVHSSERVS